MSPVVPWVSPRRWWCRCNLIGPVSEGVVGRRVQRSCPAGGTVDRSGERSGRRKASRGLALVSVLLAVAGVARPRPSTSVGPGGRRAREQNHVFVGNGSTLALGCSLTAAIISPTPCTGSTDDTVAGNVIANQPWTMYLTADTIGGNVVSNGGGPGPGQPYVQFPTKENNIRGNLIIQGWEGGWSGAIRNHVGGNLIYSKNVSVLDTDSNEVVTNTISGNSLQGNSREVQFGDSGGLPNTVGGRKLGQCASL